MFFYQSELDGLAHTPGDKTPDFGSNGVSGYRVNAKNHEAVGVGVYCWFSSPGIVVQSGVKVLHAETASSIVCPFQWVWEVTENRKRPFEPFSYRKTIILPRMPRQARDTQRNKLRKKGAFSAECQHATGREFDHREGDRGGGRGFVKRCA